MSVNARDEFDWFIRYTSTASAYMLLASYLMKRATSRIDCEIVGAWANRIQETKAVHSQINKHHSTSNTQRGDSSNEHRVVRVLGELCAIVLSKEQSEGKRSFYFQQMSQIRLDLRTQFFESHLLRHGRKDVLYIVEVCWPFLECLLKELRAQQERVTNQIRAWIQHKANSDVLVQVQFEKHFIRVSLQPEVG